MVNKFVRLSAIAVTAFALWAGTAFVAPKPLAADYCGGPGYLICRTVEHCFIVRKGIVCYTTYVYLERDFEDGEKPEKPQNPGEPEELQENG